VEAAYEAIQHAEARFKHVILLTDGWVREGDLTPLVSEQREAGITLSVVAAGSGSARYLEELAETGGGRYYPAVDILRVPDFFLKETVEAVGRYIVEEPFYALPSMPSAALRGIDMATAPPLLGYNGTTPKGTARVVLSTPRGDPLLATWQYGLGRTAAWMSDVTGRWAVRWVAWQQFPRFAAQLVGWTLPAPQVEGMNAQVTIGGEMAEEDQAVFYVEMVDSAGLPRDFLDVTATLIGPDLHVREVALTQVGAGLYETATAVGEPGTYLVRITARGPSNGGQGSQIVGQQTLGFVVPYSPEYAVASSAGAGQRLLDVLAERTGGGELSEPLAAFVHNLPATDRAREVWRYLLLFATLLFPLDVALRRVVLGSRDVRKAWEWMRERLPVQRRPGGSPEQRALGRLFEARRRARARTARADPDAHNSRGMPSAAPRSADSTESRAFRAEESLSPETPADGDALARLREAKQRARRGR
jgi:hypothetical protein